MKIKRTVTVLFIWLASTFAFNSVLIFSQLKKEDLFDKYYRPYQMDYVVRGTNNLNLIDVQSSYNKGAYNSALIQLITLRNDALFLYEGICFIEEGKFKEAKLRFKISHEIYEPHYYISCWYLGLVCIKLNEKSEAKKYLNKIRNIKTYSNQIEDILMQLK